ncbi:MAG: glycosyltransferase family 2 protein [Patescibacteria group bacterium]
MTAVPFCSIVVLNYQGEKFLQQTISSVLDINYPREKYEIIVVDNASTDQSRSIIDQLATDNLPAGRQGHQLTTIYLSKNLGFSAGNNVGVRRSKGEYVILLNNDCTVDKNWLKELVTVTEKDKNIFAVNPKVYLHKTRKIQNAGIRIFSNGYAQDRGAVPRNNIQEYEEDKGQYDKEEEIDAACAVATLYRKAILEKIGLFDERFFLYYEDVEISERAKKYGYKIMYSPKAIAYHKHASSSGQWSPFFIYQSERGRLLHLFLHFPFPLFLKEYMMFSMKAKVRFLVRLIINQQTMPINWQYIRVKYYFFFHLPILFYSKYLQSSLRRQGSSL